MGQVSFNVRRIPYPNSGGPTPTAETPRVESGAVQFGEDWPGYFLRGDDAFDIAMQIERIGRFLADLPDKVKVDVGGVDLVLAYMRLRELREDILENTVVKAKEPKDGNSP